jgi:hypothetical protein
MRRVQGAAAAVQVRHPASHVGSCF